MNKILVVSVNWLGDSLFAFPVFDNLKSNFPDSRIGVVAPGYLRELYCAHPGISTFHDLSDKAFHANFSRKVALIGALRRERYETVYLLHRSFTKALLCFCAGIPERIGYQRPKRNGLLTKAIAAPDSRNTHRMDMYLGVLRGAGLSARIDRYVLPIADAHTRAADILLDEAGYAGRVFVCIHAGANWGPKQWPIGRFAQLADRLIERHGVGIVFTGAARDAILIEQLRQLMRQKTGTANVAGKTSLLGLGALFKKATAVISADSGPLHVAAAVGAHCVALFGPTSESLTGPRGTGRCVIVRGNGDCPLPCYQEDCKDRKCMEAITVDAVFNATEEIMRAGSAAR